MNTEEEKTEEEKQKFYMKQKSFFLTYPQCNEEKQTIFNYCLVKFKPMVLVVSKEIHQDGNFHFHVWMEFEKQIIIRNARYFDINQYHCNIGKIRKTECNSRKNAIKYMTKTDKEPLVFGCDIDNSTSRTEIAKRLIDGEKLNDLVILYPSIIYDYEKLRNNIILYNIDKHKIDINIERKCFWIYGDSGVGKSYLVRMAFKELYEKGNNIWWDGYNSEDVVLFDDFDKTCVKFSYYLKIWSDNYRFNAEVKGGIIQPNYTKFIVTSNYNIEDLFYNKYNEDNELIKALKRRFKEIHMLEFKEQNSIIEILRN